METQTKYHDDYHDAATSEMLAGCGCGACVRERRRLASALYREAVARIGRVLAELGAEADYAEEIVQALARAARVAALEFETTGGEGDQEAF